MEENYKKYDYNVAIAKIVGQNDEYVFEKDEVIKIEDFEITKVTADEYEVELYSGEERYDKATIGEDVLKEVFTVVLRIKTELLEDILETQRKLLGIEGYAIKYYRKEEWRKSFAKESIRRLKETLGRYKEQVARRNGTK